MKPKSVTPFLALFTLGLTVSAHAEVLMLDFGPTASTGATLNSPYHTVAGVGFTGGAWNTVALADVGSGLLFSDGTAATGISVNLGSATSSTINLSAQPATSSALGSTTNTGVYAGNSVGTDGIFSGNASSNQRVGLQIGGLAAGTYDVYITARNTNTATNSATYTQSLFAGTSASGNFDYTGIGYSSSVLTYTNPTASSIYTDAWGEGQNYAKLSITLTAGQFLNLAVAGGGADTRGFLNSVQIVGTSIPEPSAYAALGGLAVLGFAALRRRLRG